MEEKKFGNINTTGLDTYNKINVNPGKSVSKSLETIDPVNSPGLYGLSPEDVEDLKFLRQMESLGVEDPWNSMHFYDYETAVLEGATPDEQGKWPSKYKHDLHPERFIKGGEGTNYPNMEFYDTKYNRPAFAMDVVQNDYKREDFLEDLGVVSDVSAKKENLTSKINSGGTNVSR